MPTLHAWIKATSFDLARAKWRNDQMMAFKVAFELS